MTQEEKDRKERLLIFIAHIELALSYTIMQLNLECGRLSKQMYASSKFKQKKDYGDLCNLLKRVDDHLDRAFHERIINMYRLKDGTFDANGFDTKLFEANELARLVLLYGDKTALSNENFEKIFRFIGSLTGMNVVDQETYDKFYLKTLDKIKDGGKQD